MLNLEWLRTFRTVYKTKSLSQAADMLMISQPTVSQHLSALESRIGKKLFERKSKGVIETDMGRILNTKVSGSLEMLELVEDEVVKKDSNLKSILNIGISPHLYKTILCNTTPKLGEFVHIKFGKKDELIEQIERGQLHYAVVQEKIDRFDANCYPLRPQSFVLVATPDIDLTEFEKLYKTDKEAAENWLNQHKWFAHDHQSGFIKAFWLKMFNKKRPAIIPNYVIPNEYEVLYQQSGGSGLSVAFDNIAEYFVQQGTLQICDLPTVECRELYLIAYKKTDNEIMTNRIHEMFSPDKKHRGSNLKVG